MLHYINRNLLYILKNKYNSSKFVLVTKIVPRLHKVNFLLLKRRKNG